MGRKGISPALTVISSALTHRFFMRKKVRDKKRLTKRLAPLQLLGDSNSMQNN
jgi:hypothetical protein